MAAEIQGHVQAEKYPCPLMKIDEKGKAVLICRLSLIMDHCLEKMGDIFRITSRDKRSEPWAAYEELTILPLQ